MTTGTVARWGDAWFIARRSPGQCRFCGMGGPDGDHEPTTCRACGLRVCRKRGDGDCPICFAGLLDGYWYGVNPQCGYAGCTNPPAARAPRVRLVCLDHIDRPTLVRGGVRVPLGQVVRERAAGVASGGWPYPGAPARFVWVAPDEAAAVMAHARRWS